MAQTLFSILFAVMVIYAFQDYDMDVLLKFKTTRGVSDLNVYETFTYLGNKLISVGSFGWGNSSMILPYITVAYGKNEYRLKVILPIRLRWMLIDLAFWMFFCTYLKRGHCFICIWKYLSTFIRHGVTETYHWLYYRCSNLPLDLSSKKGDVKEKFRTNEGKIRLFYSQS